MHNCPECGMACDCDGEDTWIDSRATDCTHECEDNDDYTDGLEDDLDTPIRRCIDLDMDYPTIVCLCGSTRFWREFQAAGLRETMSGKIVLSIGAASGTDDEHFGNLPRKEYDRIKTMLDELHMRKIDLCDEVLILNLDGYIGESTARELAYARKLGKRVRFLEPER
jgi:hypothetical protein